MLSCELLIVDSPPCDLSWGFYTDFYHIVCAGDLLSHPSDEWARRLTSRKFTFHSHFPTRRFRNKISNTNCFSTFTFEVKMYFWKMEREMRGKSGKKIKFSITQHTDDIKKKKNFSTSFPFSELPQTPGKSIFSLSLSLFFFIRSNFSLRAFPSPSLFRLFGFKFWEREIFYISDDYERPWVCFAYFLPLLPSNTLSKQ